MIMVIADFLGLITSEHAIQPNFTAWLTAHLQFLQDNQDCANSFASAFNVNTAVGNQLDILGQIIGQPRDIGIVLSGQSSSSLDDDHYRLALLAKIAQNNWDGTTPSLYKLWNTVFPSAPLQVVDTQKMQMNAFITNLFDVTSEEMVTAGLIVPKPMGVSLTVIGSTQASSPQYLGVIVTTEDVITLSVA